MKLIYFVGLAQAEWGFWFCPFVPQMPNFDKERFGGHWFEIYRDWDHNFWSDQKCTEDEYTPTLTKMKLSRSFVKKFWGWKAKDENISIRRLWIFDTGLDYIFHWNIWGKNQHYVIDTDYETYAIVYGCDQYFGFWQGKYATLLSRTEYLDYGPVRKAKNKLREVGYNYA